MKIRNVTFILMLGVLFSMCKKDNVNLPPDPLENGNNSPSPRLVSFSPESGAIGDTVIIKGENFSGDLDNIKVFFGNTQTKVASVIANTTNNVRKIVIRALVPQMTDITTKINVKVDTLSLVTEKYFTRR